MRNLVLTLLFALATLPLAAQERPKVAVLAVQVTGLDADIATTLTDVLTAEMDALGQVQVVGARDIEAMLGFEAQKQIMGCDDESCFAEIGGALGVDRIVSSSVGVVGETYVVSVNLINIAETTTEGRVYETITGAVDDVIDAMADAPQKLFAGRRRFVPAPTERSMTGPIGLWAVGAVGIGAGAGFAIDARGRAKRNGSLPQGWEADVETGMRNQKISIATYGVGIGAAAAGTLWYLLSGAPPDPLVSVAPVPGGVAAAAVFRF